MKKVSTLILFFAIFGLSVIAQSCTDTKPSSKLDKKKSALESDSVSYGVTLGNLRSDISMLTKRLYGKNAFFVEAQEAQLVSGTQALSLLNESGYTEGLENLPIIGKIRRVLGANGSIAILLPNWVNTSAGGDEPSSILYVLYPSESNFSTDLPTTCNGHFFNLSFNPQTAACSPCQGSRGRDNEPAAQCACGGYTGCSPCTSCKTCWFAKPVKERILEQCAEYTTCNPERFLETSLLMSIPVNTWL